MTVLRFDKGIRAFGLVPEILWALDRCVDVWIELQTNVDVVVTSGRGGKHSRTSLHFSGNACDIRSREMNDETLRAVILRLKQVLGKQFDVVYETGDQPHLHIEHQPKHAHTYLTRLAA